MKKVILACAVVILAACLSVDAAAKKNVFRGPGGATLSPLGISIDGSYDARLDALLPGYKVVNVVLENRSFDIIYLDPERDKWWVKVSDKKAPVVAIYNLRKQDTDAWSKLPDKAKNLIGYPLVLPVGAKEVFDLFVPTATDLSQFTELRAYLKSVDATLEVMVTQ
jgi:hypothetical protein